MLNRAIQEVREYRNGVNDIFALGVYLRSDYVLTVLTDMTCATFDGDV